MAQELHLTDGQVLFPPTIYVVDPKPSISTLAFPSESLRDLVAETKVWQNDEGASGLLECDRETIAKNVILAYFLSFDEFDEMLGRPEISAATFDKYWSIRRLPIEGKLDHLAEYAGRLNQDRFASTGNHDLDLVISRTVRRAANANG